MKSWYKYMQHPLMLVIGISCAGNRYSASQPGWGLKPRHQILGDDIAGRVEAVGRSVQQFQLGDEVFGISSFGAFAEYRCVPEDRLALKPTTVSFEDAATIPIVEFPTLEAQRDKGQIQSR
jgi:NADPH:quinone reductase-like Zn-dependent oxidoreductase